MYNQISTHIQYLQQLKTTHTCTHTLQFVYSTSSDKSSASSIHNGLLGMRGELQSPHSDLMNRLL